MAFSVTRLARIRHGGRPRLFKYNAATDDAQASDYFGEIEPELTVGDLIFVVNDGNVTPACLLQVGGLNPVTTLVLSVEE